MSEYITVIPAYGADYKSKKEVMAAWDSGKDFRIVSVNSPDYSRYVNKEQAFVPGKSIAWEIRYSNQTKVLIITCEDRKPIDVMNTLANRGYLPVPESVAKPAYPIATEPYFMVTRKLLDGSLDSTVFSESEMLENDILSQANDDLFQLDYLNIKRIVM